MKPVLACILACVCMASVSQAELSRPNILFILADDQRNDTLGCAGDPIVQTPNIDRLAAEGVRFKNAFVTTAICAASRASILTSLAERTHGYTFGAPPVPRRFTESTYPALLRKAGYLTGFIGKFGANYEGFDEAGLFDVFHERDRPYLKKQEDGSLRHIDEINTEQAIDILEAAPAGRPFCLSVSFSSPHGEDGDLENHYPCIDAVKGLYEDITFPAPRLSDPAIFDAHPDFLKESMNRVRYHWRWDTPEKYQKNMRAYYRMLSGVDVMIGRVLEALKRRGLADNTVVIYMADNGYYMGNRGFSGKWSHYEESLRVPLIIRDPRVPGGRVVDAMALNLDIAPTLLEIAGLNVPAHYQGRSLAPLLGGDAPADWRTSFYAEHRMDHKQIPKWEGIRNTRYVYARYDEQTPPYEFLHDLYADPDQLTNLAGDANHETVMRAMRSKCEAERDRCLAARQPQP